MTVEQLMMPRYVMILSFPQENCVTEHKVGDILIKNGIHYTNTSITKSIHEDEIVKYPHLFRKMDWWQERKLDDLPLYVFHSRISIFLLGRWKIEDEGMMPLFYNEQYEIYASNLIPATESEYNDYLNSKK